MSKKLLYQIIDNKINKIVYPYNHSLTDIDCKTLISALKLNKSINITFDLSIDDNYNKDTFNLLLILLEKNIITSLKLTLSSSIFEYYTEFKSLLKLIENNSSLQKIKIILKGKYGSYHDTNDIILLLLINSIIKNKNIKVLKIDKHIVRIEIFNYLILNNKSLKIIKFTSNYGNKKSEYPLSLYNIMYEWQYEENHLDNNDIKEVNKRIKNYYNNTFLQIINKYFLKIKCFIINKHFISKSNTEFVNDYKNIIDNLINENINVYEFINNFKNIIDNLINKNINIYEFININIYEFINDFENIIDNLITEYINIYKYINDDILYITYTNYCINMNDYTNIIKTINLNEKDDNYKSYYKLLKDKLNFINFCI